MSLLALVLVLGLKHGLDPDHLVAIDGFTRTTRSRWCGLFFSIGHGLAVTLTAVTVALIAAGEIPVGLTVYNSNAESFKRRGAPIDWIAVQPVVARPQGIGVSANAPHAEAARVFVDFVLSPEGQQLYESMGRVPVSTKVRTHMNRFEYTLVDPATVLDEQDKWTREWDKLFSQK